MDLQPKNVWLYVLPNGKIPFEEWLQDLNDVRTVATIRVKVRRMQVGHLGYWASVGEGVYEMKIPTGPGYRLYFGLDGPTAVVLLVGGDKGSQRKDIFKEKEYWQSYKRGSNETHKKFQ